ncbi:sugar phosphate isomerase/epimerase family protein [Algoriphagus halophytocola]|uniref:Sugar phosphate isomerase/epimerase n=1 Tax=Algoriphagus halophytocola TaxID=2991499 RepID=A0ABY6MN80_9BACT|nr:sugar phosphate isomerase/epimerase [Algoriphagus sp. TR-M5]UZD23664.1 sugar phosphate isomerase/epimerase [Algoriphagus sp. TR-M5]
MKNRREFLIKSALGVAGLAASPSWLHGAPALIKSYNKPNSLVNGVQIGCITYSFRSLPDQSAEATLQYVKECGISAIELMGGPAESFAGMPENPVNMRELYGLRRKQRDAGELTSDEQKLLADMQSQMDSYNKEAAAWRASVGTSPFEKLRKMYNEAGVSIYAFKPSAFGINAPDSEIAYGMNAAKALGASHVTLEHPSNDKHTLRLGKMGEQYGMSVGYHGHEQETFTFWDSALAQSKKNGLNLDAGHYIAAGHTDLMALIKKQHKRILSMHTKDRQTPANGKGNLPWGEGDTPIPALLETMSKNKYKFPATIELEYQIPEGSDAIKEVQKCVEFCINSLS